MNLNRKYLGVALWVCLWCRSQYRQRWDSQEEVRIWRSLSEHRCSLPEKYWILRHCVHCVEKWGSCCKKNFTWELLLQMGLTVWAREAKIIQGSNNLFCGTEGHPPPRPGKRNSTMLFVNMHSQQNLQEYFFCKHIFFLSSLLIIPQM